VCLQLTLERSPRASAQWLPHVQDCQSRTLSAGRPPTVHILAMRSSTATIRPQLIAFPAGGRGIWAGGHTHKHCLWPRGRSRPRVTPGARQGCHGEKWLRASTARGSVAFAEPSPFVPCAAVVVGGLGGAPTLRVGVCCEQLGLIVLKPLPSGTLWPLCSPQSFGT